MQTLSAIIVDDEKAARNRLQQILDENAFINLIDICNDGFEAIESISNNKPDLVFLDVEMPQLNGFDVLKALSIRNMPHIVFVTAYSKYAQEAFEVNAIDYVNKPLQKERIDVAIKKVVSSMGMNQEEAWKNKINRLLSEIRTSNSGLKHFVIKKGKTIRIIKLADVLWIESSGNYIKIITQNGRFMLRKTLKSVLHEIDSDSFYQIHRSTLVNIDFIDRIEETGFGDYVVFMTNKSELRMSRNYKELLEA